MKINYWTELKPFGKKGEIAHEQFSFLSQCFKKTSDAESPKSVYMWDRVKRKTSIDGLDQWIHVVDQFYFKIIGPITYIEKQFTCTCR